MWFVIEVCKHFDWQSIAHFRKTGARDIPAAIPLDFPLPEPLAEIRLATKVITGIAVKSILWMPLPVLASATFMLLTHLCSLL